VYEVTCPFARRRLGDHDSPGRHLELASRQYADQAFREELVKELLDLPIDPTLETREFAL
jgi:hypothetical protein